MESEAISFTLLGERTRTDCPNCDELITYGENSIIISYGSFDERAHFHIGETITPPCCPHLEVDVPLYFSCEQFMHEYICHLHSRLDREPFSLILKSLILVELSDNVKNVLRLNTPIEELMKQFPYEEVEILPSSKRHLRLLQ